MAGGKKATPAGYLKTYKTAVFKVHNPSHHKRAVMQHAMRSAHLLYAKMLKEFMPDETELKRLGQIKTFDRKKELAELVKKISKRLTQHNYVATGIRNGLLKDLEAQISSSAGLQDVQESVGSPTPTTLDPGSTLYQEALEDISTCTDLEEENFLRDEIARTAKAGQVRPIDYARFCNKGGFSLYQNPETKRVIALINIVTKNSRYRKQVTVKNLVSLKTGEFMSFSTKTGILLPLEFGHDFHKKRFIEEGEPMTAKLYHRKERNGKPCDDFELHVTFKYLVKKRPTYTWLGVDRGIYNLAAYSVNDEHGTIVEAGRIEGRTLRHVQRQLERRTADKQRRRGVVRGSKRQAHADEAVHVAANKIVEVAKKYDAHVVLENLKNLSATRFKTRIKGTRRGGFNKLLGRVQYEKLKNILEYKLRKEGFAKPILVRAAGTSITCPECGNWDKENRKKEQAADGDGFKMDEFVCTKCGHAADADENAARVIGLKGMWQRQLPKYTPGTTLAEDKKFDAFLRQHAEKRSRL
jgi:IS605 OrfB family transposase